MELVCEQNNKPAWQIRVNPLNDNVYRFQLLFYRVFLFSWFCLVTNLPLSLLSYI